MTEEERILKDIEKIKNFRNLAGRREYNVDSPEEYKFDIKVDNSVPHGQFIPSQIYPGSWRASEQTFKAMKKNILALGSSIDELADPYKCTSCSSDLDKQFWHFCPFCGHSFEDK